MTKFPEKLYTSILHPIDPGLFISRHAAKAVLACLAALVVSLPFPQEYRLWFVFSAFAVMVSRSGETFRKRKITAVAVFSLAALFVPLSSVLGQDTFAAAIYLFLLVFWVFMAGVLGRNVAIGGVWFLFVNGLTLCSPASLSIGLGRAGGVLAGGMAAYAVNFWLWPMRPSKVLRECGVVAVRDLAAYFAAVAASFDGADGAHVNKVRDRARTSVRRYRRIMEASGLDPLAGLQEKEDTLSRDYIMLIRVFKGVVALSRNSGFAARSPLFNGIRRQFAGMVDEAGRTFSCLAGMMEGGGGELSVGRLAQAVDDLEQGLLGLGAYKRGEGVRRDFLEAWGAIYAMKSLVAEFKRINDGTGETATCA